MLNQMGKMGHLKAGTICKGWTNECCMRGHWDAKTDGQDGTLECWDILLL